MPCSSRGVSRGAALSTQRRTQRPSDEEIRYLCTDCSTTSNILSSVALYQLQISLFLVFPCKEIWAERSNSVVAELDFKHRDTRLHILPIPKHRHMSSTPSSDMEYWLPGYQLSRQIVLRQLAYFLGPSAKVRPYSYLV
jgi:hypothetical protein